MIWLRSRDNRYGIHMLQRSALTELHAYDFRQVLPTSAPGQDEALPTPKGH